MKQATAALLLKNVHELELSRSLTHLFDSNRLGCLKDLLDCPMEEWFGFTGFSQHLLNEVNNFLEKNALQGMVRE